MAEDIVDMEDGAAQQIGSLPFADHIPVFRQIALILRQRIGVSWQAGDELPSEGELAQAFGVNRNTLRRAIELLVAEKLLDRRRGMKVRVLRLPDAEEPKLEAEPTQLFQMRPGTRFKVLSFALQSVSPEAASQLQVPMGTEVYRIDRLLMSGNEVLAYLIVYVPVDIGEFLKGAPLTDETVGAIVFSKLGRQTGRVRQSIEAALADASVATQLGLAPGSAALKCSYIISDEKSRPVVAATYYYAGSRFRMALEINISPENLTSGAKRIESWPLSVATNFNNGNDKSSAKKS